MVLREIVPDSNIFWDCFFLPVYLVQTQIHFYTNFRSTYWIMRAFSYRYLDLDLDLDLE